MTCWSSTSFKTSMTRKAPVLMGLAGCLLPGAACSASSPQSSLTADGPEGLAAAIRSAVQREDVPGFMALIHEGGLRCGDSPSPKAKELARIQAKTGLYPGLWSTELLRQKFSDREAERADAVSYKEFFDNAPSVKPTIEGGKDNGYPCWQPKCGPASYLWRFEYVRDEKGRYWIVGVGC